MSRTPSRTHDASSDQQHRRLVPPPFTQSQDSVDPRCSRGMHLPNKSSPFSGESLSPSCILHPFSIAGRTVLASRLLALFLRTIIDANSWTRRRALIALAGCLRSGVLLRRLPLAKGVVEAPFLSVGLVKFRKAKMARSAPSPISSSGRRAMSANREFFTASRWWHSWRGWVSVPTA
jgi:hypothetical protein